MKFSLFLYFIILINIFNYYNNIYIKFYIRFGIDGYSNVAKNIIYSLYKFGLNISTHILYYNDKNIKTIKDELVLSLQENNKKYDYVIIHDYPIYWKNIIIYEKYKKDNDR